LVEIVMGRFSTYCSFFLIVFCFRTSSAQPAQIAGGSSPPAIIKSVDVSLQPHSIAISIAVSAPFVPQGVRLTAPDRLVFDFPGYELSGASRRIEVNRGSVKAARLSLFQVRPPVTRIVVDLNQPAEFEIKTEGNQTVIDIPFAQTGSIPTNSTHPASAAKEHAGVNAAPQNQPLPKDGPRPANSRTSAYALQAKARALRLEDLQSLEQQAAAGDPEAQTMLGLAYHDAVLLKRDDGEALRWLHKAADQNFMAAQESLGIFYQTGIGMSQPNSAEALDWYKKAVQQGSFDAATNIALMYAGGIGVAKDPAQAMIWFRRAAEGGDATAQYNLALIYGEGKGVEKDYKECVLWLAAAADQNVLPAMLDLASFYMHPPDGASADLEQAIHYYEKAANLGSDRAQAILGSIFATGAQGKPDYEQAVTWYRKAADQGQRDGQFGLGVRYELGQGVPMDLQEARRLFTAAADQGQAGAQYQLATMWEEGKGDAADPAMAQHYYQLAAEQGMAKAQFRLGRLLKNKKESRSERVSAYKWLMLAQSSMPESAPVLSDLRNLMNPDEIAEGERAVDDWRIAHRKVAK
jgi:TPR repeat protein